jgi:hypothetical protein
MRRPLPEQRGAQQLGCEPGPMHTHPLGAAPGRPMLAQPWGCIFDCALHYCPELLPKELCPAADDGGN